MTGEHVFWIFVLGIVGATLVVAVPLVGLFWAKVIRHHRTTELKIAMVERGYSPEDIERVLRAGEPDKLAVAPSRRGSEYAR